MRSQAVVSAAPAQYTTESAGECVWIAAASAPPLQLLSTTQPPRATARQTSAAQAGGGGCCSKACTPPCPLRTSTLQPKSALLSVSFVATSGQPLRLSVRVSRRGAALAVRAGPSHDPIGADSLW